MFYNTDITDVTDIRDVLQNSIVKHLKKMKALIFLTRSVVSEIYIKLK